MIHFSKLPIDSEVCYRKEADGRTINIAVGEIIKWCRLIDHPVITVPVTPANAAAIVPTFTGNAYRKNQYTDIHFPLVLFDLGNGVTTLADGKHRYVSLSERGETSTTAWLIEERDWRRYIIEHPAVLPAVKIESVKVEATSASPVSPLNDFLAEASREMAEVIEWKS